MIFGVPIGTQTVHMSVDITDIGKYSMTPAAMVVNLGYSPNLFTDNNTRIKPSTDLNDLPHIETQEISVDVVPFWGDATNFEIGITRQDFRIRSVLANTFTIFGSVFTDGSNSMWGYDHDGGTREIRELYYIRSEGNLNISIQSKRIGQVTEKIYTYPVNITDAQIDAGTVDPATQMVLLDPSEYSVYKRDGDFAVILNCNRRKIVTDELGNETQVSDSSPNGIFTQFKGFMTLEITEDTIPMDFQGDIGNYTALLPFRYILKFPQHATRGHSFSEFENTDTQNWRKEYYTFSGGNLYSISKFHGTVLLSHHDDGDNDNFTEVNGFSTYDAINTLVNQDPFFSTGVIQTNDDNTITGNTKYQMIPNSFTGQKQIFGANWLNLSVHLPQVAYMANGYAYIKYWRSNSNFTSQYYHDTFFFEDNRQAIAGGQINTKWYARADLHWTDFINVPKIDILAMNAVNSKGFTNLDPASPLNGSTYRNGIYTPPATPATYNNWSAPCPINGGKVNASGVLSDPADQKTYFFKGFKTADCIDFVVSLGLV
jgi:hypothetical protein